MRRSLSLLLLSTLPIWAQFQPAPPDVYAQSGPQSGPNDAPPPPPQYDQAQAQYPTSPQQQPYPQQQQPPAGYPQQGGAPQDEGRDWATDQQHGVARLRIVQGDVNVKRGDNGVLTGAVMNAPVFAHDQLQTGPGSRAEIEMDSAMMIRLAPDTDLGFANLTFGSAQAQLAMGTIILRIIGNSPTQIEVDTPSVAFRPLTQGEYRISVFDNGTTQVTVRSGRMEMSGPRGSENIEQGQTMMVRGDANNPEFQQGYELPRDQFDEWSTSRDSEMMAAHVSPNVGSNVYGAEDLDRYGSWVPSQYGQVWAPQVNPDWSPYSNGQWTYADYYGWTWVGAEPWGWAPYHYGRWFYNAGIGWCWWPGARGLAFGFGWSPALVSFFGFGGGLGWITLAPFELFHPWWGHGFGAGYGVFRGYDAQRFYRNAGIRGGAMTAGLNGFAGPGHRFSAATSGQLHNASVYHGSVPFSPTASSYRFTDRAVNANPRFSQANNRTFFSRSSSSFAGGRVGSSYGAASRSSNTGRAGGWQGFGSPAPRSQSQQGFYGSSSRQGGGAESGWHGFGTPASPHYSAPSAPRYSAPSNPGYSRAPQYSAPRYSAPSAPRYSAPSAPRYNAPSAPRYQAPKSNGGGGGGHASSGGGHAGGGGHGGGGGHHR